MATLMSMERRFLPAGVRSSFLPAGVRFRACGLYHSQQLGKRFFVLFFSLLLYGCHAAHTSKLVATVEQLNQALANPSVEVIQLSSHTRFVVEEQLVEMGPWLRQLKGAPGTTIGSRLSSSIFRTTNAATLILSDLVFENIGRDVTGGALRFGGNADVRILNSAFNGTDQPVDSPDNHGGAIYFEDNAIVAIVNSTFNGMQAGAGGAIYFEDTATVTILNSQFTLNSCQGGTPSSGGAAFLFNGTAAVNMSNSTFSDNVARNGGDYFIGAGAFGFNGNATVSVSHCNFFSNSVDNNWSRVLSGAFRGGSDLEFNGIAAALTVSNSKFEDGDVDGGLGGAIHFASGATSIVVTISDSSFRGYSAQRGGAIDFENGAQLTMSNTVFASGSVSDETKEYPFSPYRYFGGAVYMAGGFANLSRCSFSSNRAEGYAGGGGQDSLGSGAAFWFGQGSSVIIADSNFTENHVESSYGGGGAVYIGNADTIHVSGSNFSLNSAKGVDGAGLCIQAGEVITISGSTFSNNSVQSERGGFQTELIGGFGGFGGAVFVDGNDITVLNSTFSYNTAVGSDGSDGSDKCPTAATVDGGYGGAMSVGAPHFHNNLDATRVGTQTPQFTLQGCDFHANYGINDGGAIAIYMQIEEPFAGLTTISHNVFSNNNASRSGGAVTLQDRSTHLSNNLFIANTAQVSGGAVDLNGTGTFRLSENIFEDNTVQSRGGAVNLNGNGRFRLSSDVFKRNYANGPGGALFMTATRVDIDGANFISNAAHEGGAAYISTSHAVGPSTTFVDCTFSHNLAVSSGGAVQVQRQLDHLTMSRSDYTKKRLCSGITSEGVWDITVLVCNASQPVEQSPDTDHTLCPIAYISDPSRASNDSCKSIVPAYRPWVCTSQLLVQNSSFVSNTINSSNGMGGALSLRNGCTQVTNSSFRLNSATFMGGTMYLGSGSGTVSLTGSDLLATGDPSVRGVAIFSESGGNFSAANSSTVQMDVGVHSRIGPTKSHNLLEFTEAGTWNASGMSECPPGYLLQSASVIGKGSVVDWSLPVTQSQESTTYSLKSTAYPCPTLVNYISESCHPCPSNSYSIQGGTDRTGAVQATCLACPAEAFCPGGCSVLAQDGFHGAITNQTGLPQVGFDICPSGYCSRARQSAGCLGNLCAQGHDPVSPLCGACLKHYSATLGSIYCRPDEQCTDYWFWPVALLGGFGCALALVCLPLLIRWLAGYLAESGGIGKFKDWLLCKSDNDDKPGDGGIGWIAKVFFYYYQIAPLLISPVTVMTLSENIRNSVSTITGFGFLQVHTGGTSGICPFTGLTQITKRLFECMMPLLILGCVGAIIGGLRIKRRNANSAETRRSTDEIPCIWTGAFLQIVLLGYAQYAKVTLELLRCVSVTGRDGLYLFIDGSVQCWQQPWQYITLLFLIFCIVPCFLMLGFGGSRVDSGDLSVRSFLCGCLYSGPYLIYWAVQWLLGRSGSNARSSNTADERSPSQQAVFEILSASYESGIRQSWESVYMLRRLVLLMIASFVTEPSARLLFLCIGCMIALVTHAEIKPFKSAAGNLCETVSLSMLVCLAAVGLLIESTANRLDTSVSDNAGLLPDMRAAQATMLLLPACLMILVAFVALLLVPFWSLIIVAPIDRNYLMIMVVVMQFAFKYRSCRVDQPLQDQDRLLDDVSHPSGESLMYVSEQSDLQHNEDE